jgi:DNA-binding CsgD family transcriptional regulator
MRGPGRKYREPPPWPRPGMALSECETQVVRLIAVGKQAKEIAHSMGITVSTTFTYMGRCRTKLGCRSNIEVAIHAIRNLGMALLLAASLSAQAPTVSVSGPPGMQKAGSTVTVSANLSGSGTTGIQDVQFTLPISWAVLTANGSAITGLGKTITCDTILASLRCIVDGGASLLADGQLATFQITIPRNAGGTLSLAGSNLLAAKTDAANNVSGVPVNAGSPFILGITSACDTNLDGVINSADLALVNAQVNGKVACTTGDLDSNGTCDAVDAQIVANAVAGGICAAK